MDRDELWRRLVPAMEHSADYQQVLQCVKSAETEYLAVLETLSPEQQEVLQSYIAACEALDDSLIYLAYQIGLTDAV